MMGRLTKRCLPVVAALLAGLAANAQAGIVKCRTESGKLTYQEAPCPRGASQVGGSLGEAHTAPPPPSARPKAASPGPGRSSQELTEELQRTGHANLVRDVKEFEQQCAKGQQEYCVLAICGHAGLEDTDASVIACAKAHGFRVGDGWVANEAGGQAPGIRPYWTMSITCMRKIAGMRPRAILYRKFEVPAESFDVDAEATKACEARYAELQERGTKRRR